LTVVVLRRAIIRGHLKRHDRSRRGLLVLILLRLVLELAPPIYRPLRQIQQLQPGRQLEAAAVVPIAEVVERDLVAVLGVRADVFR